MTECFEAAGPRRICFSTRPLLALEGALSVDPPRSVWDRLVSGSSTVVGSATSETDSWLVIRPLRGAHGARKFGSQRLTEALQDVLCGKPQKTVAIELGICASTLTTALGKVLQGMGIAGSLSRVPIALALLAQAARHPDRLSVTVYGDPQAFGQSCLVRIERRDNLLACDLTACEFAVTSRLLEGRTHQQVARERGVSTRTVANQLSAVFRKLGTSGRFDLLRITVERRGGEGVTRNDGVQSAPRSLSLAG